LFAQTNILVAILFCLTSILIDFETAITVASRVPGSIFTDLIRSGILAEDPYYGQNDLNYKWVSYDNWTYHKTFMGNQF